MTDRDKIIETMRDAILESDFESDTSKVIAERIFAHLQASGMAVVPARTLSRLREYMAAIKEHIEDGDGSGAHLIAKSFLADTEPPKDPDHG